MFHRSAGKEMVISFVAREKCRVLLAVGQSDIKMYDFVCCIWAHLQQPYLPRIMQPPANTRPQPFQATLHPLKY